MWKNLFANRNYTFYKTYSLFKRNLKTVFLICIICMAILFLCLCIFITRAAIDEMSTQTLQTISLLSENAQQRIDELMLASQSMKQNQTILTNLILSEETNYTDWVDGMQEAWRMQRAYPHLLFLACYNPLQKRIYSTIELSQTSLDHLYDWIKENQMVPETTRLELVDIRLEGESEQKGSQPTIILVTAITATPAQQPALLLIGMDCASLQTNLITAARQSGNAIFLMDSSGKVLSHTDSEQIRQDYSQKPFIQQMLNAGKDYGVFSESLDGQTLMVAYAKNSMGYYLVSLTSFNSILSRVWSQRWLLVVIPIIMLLLAILFSFIGAQIMFFPIKKIVSPFTESIQQPGADLVILLNQMKVYRENLDTQITGTAKRWIWKQLSPEEMMQVPELLSSLHAPYYAAALLRVDRSMDFLRLEDSEQNKVTSALRNECMDALEAAGYHGIYIPIKFYRFDVIIPMQNKEDRVPIAEILQKGLDSFYEKLHQPCCASLSEPVNRIELIPDATTESLYLLVDRFYENSNTPRVYLDQVYKKEQLRYDYVWENDLWNAIKNNDEDELLQALNRFMEKIYCCRYEYARFFTEQMLLNVTAKWMKYKPDEILLPYYDDIQRIISQDTLDLIHIALKQYLTSLLSVNQPMQTSKRNNVILESAIRLTKQHFREPTFSASSIAEILGISTIYFNRVFKQSSGESYSTYLNICRLDMVARLLRTTQEPLSKIYHIAGISNENYCYVLFKKYYGMTPNQYRQNYDNAQQEETRESSNAAEDDTPNDNADK